MFSSGTTAIATTDDTAVDLLNITGFTGAPKDLYIINEGSIAGFFSLDGGTTWGRLPAGPSSVGPIRIIGSTSLRIQIKRIASGSNLANVWAFTN